MIRSLDPTPFNIIAQDPMVRPWLGFGREPVDLTPLITDPNRIHCALLTDKRDGAYVLVRLHPALYSAHTLALPSARGRPMLHLMKDGFEHMFMATDANEIVTMVPDGNDPASRWADAAGFRETFRRERFFPLIDEMVGGSFRSLAYQDWVMKDARHATLGKNFHTLLTQAGGEVDHEEDRAHDMWVGATLGGCLEGNTIKAVSFYNRWAAQAGYEQAKILSATPPVVDIGSAVLGLSSGRLDVLKTRTGPLSGRGHCL